MVVIEIKEVAMNRKIYGFRNVICLLILGAMLAVPNSVFSQSDRTVGLVKRDISAYEGYTLYKPLAAVPGGPVYLINNAGNPVHQWTIPLPTRPGGEVFLRKNGELVLTTDQGFYAINPDSSVAWVVDSTQPTIAGQERWFGHHEVVELPNGNMLVPGFIEKTRAEAKAAGFDVESADECPTAPDLTVLRVDNIWEVAPIDPQVGFKSGWKVVWRWNIWDHFTNDPNDRKKAFIGYDDPASGICGQYIQGAWTFGRFNALGYHPRRKEIVMSASLFNEIWIIDHKVTTEEAKGPAGDLLYRWGNPYAYGAGEPFVSPSERGDQKLSFQHRVQWIPKGYPGQNHILIFNNGTDWGDSSVIEIKPPLDGNGKYIQPPPGQAFGPLTPVWQYDEYDTPGSFSAALISSAQRLPNGNTLINNGPAGYFFEVTCNGEKVWEYINPAADAAQGDNAPFGVYRAWRYAPDYPGLVGANIPPREPLELYPTMYTVDVKPGSCKNTINRERTTGKLALAILGSEDLDVTTIDPRSVLLEGFPAVKWAINDVSSIDHCDCGDGYPDLVLKWDRPTINVALDNATPGSEFLMQLTGYSSDGWFIGGEEVFVLK
jgi:hypothetical protein